MSFEKPLFAMPVRCTLSDRHPKYQQFLYWLEEFPDSRLRYQMEP